MVNACFWTLMMWRLSGSVVCGVLALLFEIQLCCVFHKFPCCSEVFSIADYGNIDILIGLGIGESKV